MEINNVSDVSSQSFEYRIVKSKETKPDENKQVNEDNVNLTNWQKDILVQALDNLEKLNDNENSHPLSKSRWAPIESFEEALIELSWIKSPFFKTDAALAQANIKPETIVSLFLE